MQIKGQRRVTVQLDIHIHCSKSKHTHVHIEWNSKDICTLVSLSFLFSSFFMYHLIYTTFPNNRHAPHLHSLCNNLTELHSQSQLPRGRCNPWPQITLVRFRTWFSRQIQIHYIFSIWTTPQPAIRYSVWAISIPSRGIGFSRAFPLTPNPILYLPLPLLYLWSAQPHELVI